MGSFKLRIKSLNHDLQEDTQVDEEEKSAAVVPGDEKEADQSIVDATMYSVGFGA